MKKSRFINSFLSIILTVSIFTISLPQIGYAQTGVKTSDDLQSRLAKIEAKVEKRRKELGIPGMSLAIVKDGKVIYSKGLGYKDFENKIPMTADTQLAIGSATKAFTGLSILMSQDEGKLSIDDNPKKYLSYFKINDPEIDKKIQVRDLLSHSSGLNRTDLAMVTGKLNRVELIKVASEAKPMAGLREKFYYQNIMFAAAGEIVAKVQNQSWEKFVPQKIFQPLGMTNSTMSIKQMKKAKDFSFGYDYNFDTKKTKKRPFRSIDHIAPAGSINSSANDMTKWLRFILNGGELDGKRLVSKKGFEEWIKPQMKIAPNGSFSYGFGWFLQDWKGKKVVQHGGNIDGFNALVAMIPEEKLGFVMLTNVSGSSLGNELMPMIWSGILETPKTLPSDAKKEVGKYRFTQANFDIDVLIEDGNLVAKVPGQPTYILEKVSGRKYKLSNAPAGFFITFKDTEAFLEQPQGNFTLPKVGTKSKTKTKTEKSDVSVKKLIGKYQLSQRTIEIKEVKGKVSLVVGNQPPYPLMKRDDGNFGSSNLPETYYLKVKKGKNGEILGVTMVQPEGEFEFEKVNSSKQKDSAPKISVDELMAKTIEAIGGTENILKIKSRVSEVRIDAIHQGVKGFGKVYSKMPNKTLSETTLTAVGKKIATVRSYFDGQNGGEEYSFSPAETYTGKRLEDVKFANEFGFTNWKELLEKAEVKGVRKIKNEECYVVVMTPKKANAVTYFISTKTFLPIRKSGVVVSSTSSRRTPVREDYEDYRKIDGVMIPFKVTNHNPGMGEIITYVTKVKHNVKISDKKFK